MLKKWILKKWILKKWISKSEFCKVKFNFKKWNSNSAFQTRPNSLIDTIASNNGYRQKMPYANLLTHSLTHLLSYPKSRDAIASKNICTLLKTKKMLILSPIATRRISKYKVQIIWIRENIALDWDVRVHSWLIKIFPVWVWNDSQCLNQWLVQWILTK